MPGASGNISSEDAIHMLEAVSYDTGIDMKRLFAVARRLPHVGHGLPGHVAKAGLITDLHPAGCHPGLDPRSMPAEFMDCGSSPQ